jgi:hypothetical protein
MLASLLLVLAQGTSNTQEAPETGAGIALILGTLLAIVLVFTLGFLLISRRTKASKGGVEPVPGSRERGQPPFESVERDS